MTRSKLYYLGFIAYLFLLGLLGDVGEVIATGIMFSSVVLLWFADRFHKDTLLASLLSGHVSVRTNARKETGVQQILILGLYELFCVGPWIILNLIMGWTVLLSICAIAYSVLAHFIVTRLQYQAAVEILKKNHLLAEDEISA